MSMMFSFFFLFPVFLLEGGNSLSGILDLPGYWEREGVAYEAEALRDILEHEEGVDVERVEALIRQLGHEAHAKRKAATEALAAMGSPARPMLEKGAKNPDPEVATRSKRILQSLPAEGSDRATRRWMAIRGLAALGDDSVRDLLQTLADADNAREAEAARRALKKLDGDAPAGAPELEPRQAFLARLPASTSLVGQVTATADPSEQVREAIQEEWVQTPVIALLERIGDLRVDRVSVAMNQEGFLDEDDLRILVYLEGRYDALRVARWLLADFDFEPASEGEMVYLVRDNFLVWPMSDTRMLVVIHDRGGAAPDQALRVAKNFNQPNDAPRLKEGLLREIGQHDEKSTLWAALLIPPGNDAFGGVEEAGVFDSARARADRGEDAISFDVVAEGADPDAVSALIDKRKEQLAGVIAMFGNVNDPSAGVMRELLNSLKLEAKATTATLKGDVPKTLFSIALGQIKQMMEMRKRMRQRMHRQGNIHLQQGLEGQDPFGF